jgi:topoisomerase IA-like protein
MKEGFIVGKGDYAAIPFGNQLMVIYNGEQLKVCRTEQSARNFIAEHKKQVKAASVPVKKASTKRNTTTKKPVESKSPTKKTNGRPSKRNPV